MPIIVSFLESGNTSAANVDRYPDECPVCHARTTPRFVAAATQTASARQICFQCTSEPCKSLFIATYTAETALSFRLDPRSE
jgi:hypothetical protein